MTHHETALQDNGPGTTAWARCDCDWTSEPCVDLFEAAGAARRHLAEATTADEQCTAWLADDHGSAECARDDAHDGVTTPHEGPLNERTDQIATWYDDDPGAHPSQRALPTAPIEVCS